MKNICYSNTIIEISTEAFDARSVELMNDGYHPVGNLVVMEDPALAGQLLFIKTFQKVEIVEV
jgi:hypothetical protein